MIQESLQLATVETSTKLNTQRRSRLTQQHRSTVVIRYRPTDDRKNRSTVVQKIGRMTTTTQLWQDATWERTRTSHPIDRLIRPSIDTHHQQSIDNNNATSIDNNPIPNTTVSKKDKFDNQFLTPDEFGIFRDPNSYAKAIDGRTLHVSREDIADILQTANGADNQFMHHRSNPEQKATKEQPEFGRGAYDLYGNKKFYWEEKDEYGVYRDDRRYARDLDGNTIRLHNTDIRRKTSREVYLGNTEPSYICLPEHANFFTQTKLVPEIYTKDEINEITGWPTTCMEEMKQDIAKIQHATDVARSSSIDRDQHTSINVRQRTSIDNQMPTSVDENTPRPHMIKLDGRCDDIYFPMDLNISALTSKIEAIQGELVEIQRFIARRPEASSSIDRHNNKSADFHH
ncbi:hypothetical protein F2Q69_00023179 [Brassica cretica]|uniref:Uncharacterized protein n=1 Tax=Brassica cretica TaxID=69181 RepID=A0A8S9QB19_BRACR|nr:hypothetical protein F2Q69_00023179 [Brassica cretica]